jgi:non-canonical purine NTP pyrophosphatase (RdgB/HAM1 family)
MKLLLASSNPGKLREYRELASESGIELAGLPNFTEIEEFEERAPTFAENAAGKAQYYSRFTNEHVLADDSGLVVPTLDGAPGVLSARYAGANATDQDRINELLREMKDKKGDERRAKFVCVTAVAKQGRVLAVTSDFAQGVLTEAARGGNGFGYDPIFLFAELGRTYAELSNQEKNLYSHRGKAFRSMLGVLAIR